MVQTVFGVILETIQVMVDVAGGLGLVNKNPTRAADPENLEISIFENQRWWAGSGFTGQVCHANHDVMLYSMHWVSKSVCCNSYCGQSASHGPISRAANLWFPRKRCLLL
jgi:hypothetical protein